MALSVKVGSGSIGPDTWTPLRWQLRASHSIGLDQRPEAAILGLVWTAPTSAPVTIFDAKGNAVATVGSDQMAVFGHYDDPQDAKSPTIKFITGEPKVTYDADFAWLYTLLEGAPRVSVPEIVQTPGEHTIHSPLTSTCFGGTWP